ncbi:pilus assembly protein [Pelagibacterium sp. 26DY04]|uniref:TadE/TadG family type IV pilus assembly protein n=1 Tax=Pelagibacterium sp. 26DY04 TaxID=2967130 RepID=UPI002814B065|nr:pilus assembly protein [Pelagibacterium sp. 26DY04]WMT87420.1 pilus assembly protein [Pelagibacterium sp. 26DY04]
MSRSHFDILSQLVRFLRNPEGVAAVEFAMIAPMLLILYLGATDITQALAIDRKLGQFATTVSDQIARRTMVTEEDVQAVIDAGEAIMRPFDFDRTKLRFTIVKVEGNSARVTGATEYNWTVEEEPGESYELTADLMDLGEGHHVIIATAAYDFTPLFGLVFNGTMNLEQRSVHLLREQTDDFGFTSATGPTSPSDEAGEDEESGEGEEGQSSDEDDGTEDAADDDADAGNDDNQGDDDERNWWDQWQDWCRRQRWC